MQTQLYVLGDIHFDGSDNAILGFCDHLLYQKPAHLVILGDLFEYWLDTDASIARAALLSQRLKGLKQAGWQLDLILGNREMGSGRRLGTETGCTLHNHHLDVALGEHSIHITHGDRLCQDPGHRFLLSHARAFWFRFPLSIVPGTWLELLGRSFRRLSRGNHQHQPQRSAGASLSMLNQERVRSAGRRHDAIVAGHIHECLQTRIAGKPFVLVGEWTARRGTYLTGCRNGQLQLWSWPDSAASSARPLASTRL